MVPFRDLLKKEKKCYWDDVLQKLFEEARKKIAEEVFAGLEWYDVNKWTAVLTDYSKAGLGFIMTQKHCSCKKIHPLCCEGGWKVCMVGISFLVPAESRYSRVEGELLGVVNALHKTRYYTQGAEKLIIGTDHKPLLGVLDKSMELIDNPRLQRLAQKTLSWNF